mmetsp:Transcript_80683/g.261493  ORF Transcript_80683/g.261493 Transcript_80683/m.261493 type:complete len:294 (-) Transcript_80683:410-1291(-)
MGTVCCTCNEGAPVPGPASDPKKVSAKARPSTAEFDARRDAHSYATDEVVPVPFLDEQLDGEGPDDFLMVPAPAGMDPFNLEPSGVVRCDQEASGPVPFSMVISGLDPQDISPTGDGSTGQETPGQKFQPEEELASAADLYYQDARAEFPDGSVFEGQFCGQVRHGQGKFMWANNCTFEGQFENNDMHGEGLYRWSDGSTYSGQWQRNEMGPKGVMRWTDGRTYEGHFSSGRKHGEGQLVWPNGRMYEGQWYEGKQHGFGITVNSTGVVRKSEWEHGKLKRWLGGDAEVGDPP